ncbi:MAG: hypothetical protein IKV88_02850 [Clostridia bacterium]|nr:hypothetical protein [Clostridia bacterium]
MRFINSFLNENRKLFFALSFVWICSSVSGVIFASKLNEDIYPDIFIEISDSFSHSPSVVTMIQNQADYLLKVFIAVIISSLGAIFSPLIFLITGFDAFSSGLSAALIVKTYSLRGALTNLFIHVLPLSVSLPLYFVMFISGVKFSLSPRTAILHQRVSERRKQWISYLLFQGAICLFIFAVDVIKAFLCKGIIGFLN